MAALPKIENPVRLRTIPEAANEIGAPAKSLRAVAEKHGFLIRMGRALRIDPTDYPELKKKCRVQAKVPASTSEKTGSTSLGTGAPKSARVHEISAKLKARSKGT
jgi:hypothetical protein